VRTDLVAIRNEGDSVSELRTDTKRDAPDEDFLLRLKAADRLVAEISRIEASAGSQAGKSEPGDPDWPGQIEELSNRLRSVCRHAGAGHDSRKERACRLFKILFKGRSS
jgi:hypothetical protein